MPNQTIQSVSTKRSAVPAEATQSHPVLTPAVDIFEGDAGFEVYADVPGIGEDALEIMFEDESLKIEASVAGEGVPEDEKLTYRRRFKIPDSVDVEGIKASLQHGTLHLHLPKSRRAQPRKISVTAN
ncbi:MAG: Hsp20/alpha crystallin family protein [Nannocystaceae bacterium]